MDPSTVDPPRRTGANAALLEVHVWGEFACFTRPEMKVERVSYPVMTPTAARGVLEAIFWRPEFRWQIREIHVLNPIRWFSILRNEVNTRASERVARKWEADGRGGYHASGDRAQRHTLALRDVAYVIRAAQVFRPDVTDDPAKYRDQFRRRVQDGRCFATPFLGCREFSASFGPVDPNQRPMPLNEDFGRILWEIDYRADGQGDPRFFDARVVDGVMHVPPATKGAP